MAAEIKTAGSNYRGTFAGHELIEVSVTDGAANGAYKSDEIPLGRTYRSVKPVAAAISASGTVTVPTYTEVVNTSTVRVGFAATGNVVATATFECEV